MPFDPTDPDQAAAVETAKAALRTETASTLAALATARDAEKVRADGLAGELAATKATADQAFADYTAAKAAGESTAAELAALRAAAQAAQAASDAAKVADLPESLRKLVPDGLAGDALAAWCTNAKAAIVVAPAGLNGGTGSPEVPTEADMEWARKNGHLGAKPATIIRASAAFGPRAEAARRAERAKKIAAAS